MTDPTLLAAVMLAGNLPIDADVPDELLAYFLDAAHRLEAMDERRREWCIAASNYDARFKPCRFCGELLNTCDCLPF